MIKNRICRMCGKELDHNAWYCYECKKINDAAKQREAYRKTKLAKKDFTNRKLARLKALEMFGQDKSLTDCTDCSHNRENINQCGCARVLNGNECKFERLEY